MHLETSYQQLTQQLATWQDRRRAAALLLWVPRGLLAGLLAAVVLAAFARLRPLLSNSEVGLVALVLGLIGAIAAALFVLLRRPTLATQARLSDQQFGLQERVSTALELYTGDIETEPELQKRQMADTLAAVARVDPAAALPYQIDTRDWLLILIALALIIAAVILPNPQADILGSQRLVQQTINEQISTLEALETQIQQNPDLTDEQRQELLEPIQNALQQLEQGDLTQEQAVATLSEAEAQLRDLEAQNNTESLRRQLEAAGQSLANNPNGQSVGESLQQGDLAQASTATADLADQLPQLTPEERAELARDLAETAAALEGTDSELAQQLAEAATALEQGDTTAAQQSLQEASSTLRERAQAQAAAEQAQQAAGEVSQGRQEVAQAGQQQQGGQQAGQQEGQQAGQQGQTAEGNQSGQGGNQPGQNGQGDGQAGVGEAGQGEGTGTNGAGPENGGAAGGTQGGGRAESVFVPEFRDLSGTEGVQVELPAECVASPESCGGLLSQTPTDFGPEESLIPYSQVYGEYRDAAYEALADDYVPLGLKGYVRDYFSSLEPSE